MLALEPGPDRTKRRARSRFAGLNARLMAGPSALALGLVFSMSGHGPVKAQAVNLGPGVNNILADGRTQTQVRVQGNTTSITTNTVSRGTGFNSFSDFQQAAGTRVDLYVPSGAGNLVNIVRNGPVVIDGVLNAYKDGQIGGNVFFSSSDGFIVGQNGVVNVGTLTANTPTRDFLEGVIGPDGRVNDAMAGQLMRGEIPISPNGHISISGVVNAEGGITLQGSSVSINGQVLSQNGFEFDQRVLFESSVNTGGMVEGGALISRGGVIEIVAAGDVKVGGRIDASAQAPGQGGQIAVRSGRDITIEGGARLSADGAGVAGAGGTIEIIAGDTLFVEDHAVFTARGSGAGAGGFIELSGQTAIIGAITANLGSDSGAAGTLLFDPYDLIVGGVSLESGPGDNYSFTGSILSDGAHVILQADNSITVASGGVIDTRSASGASGNITLEAPFITIADGAHLRADVTNGSGAAAGNIVLDARAVEGGLLGTIIGSSGAAGIIIENGAILRGGDISLLAAASARAGLLPFAGLEASATIVIGGTGGGLAQIVASGHFLASAEASIVADTADGIALPLGVVVADALASVVVGNGADITAASASLSASSDVSVKIATESLAPDSSPADAAVAVAVIDSQAIVDVAGSARLAITGALGLDATNSVTADLNATPQAAALGASVAVSVVKALTSVTIGGAAQVSAASIALDAQTSTDITARAVASAAGGDAEPDSDSVAADYLDADNEDGYSEYASTSDGAISVVGGLAISDLTSTTLARIASSAAVTATGSVSVESASVNSAEVVADGSAVESATGIGVAVGINLARISNEANVGQGLQAGSLNVGATMLGGGVNTFSTIATSGAGATDIGVAGSLATNLIDTQSMASIAPGAAVTVTGGGAVSLTSENRTDVVGKAVPVEDGGASGDSVGVGVSAAINIIANRARAELGNNATLTGAGGLTLSALGEFSVETEAEAGSEGGISITPALALSLVNNATSARIGMGSLLSVAGDIEVSAVQQAKTVTSASGEAAGSDVAIGAALALALVNDTVEATTARSITTSAGGTVGFIAMGASFSELSATASAMGAAAGEDNGAAEEDGPSVDEQVTTQLTMAQTRQEEAGIGDEEQQDATSEELANEEGRSAATSEGGVSVAAAVGVNVQTAKVSAGVPNGVVISAAGALSILTASNTDGEITANGSAVGSEGVTPSQVGIGVAVAVNKVSASNEARLGVANHTVGGLNIEAGKRDVALWVEDSTSTATRADSYLASATSGAGASSVGIAGSLALNLIDTASVALVAPGAGLTVTGGGAVSLSADNRADIVARALPVEGAGASGDSVGVGVSAAINIVANRSRAELGNNATLTGAGSLALSANGVFTVESEAKAGSSGGVSITPALALSLVNNATSARIGSGNLLTVAGNVSVSAIQQSKVTTTASGKAAGSNVAIGAALALALIDDVVEATTARSITTTSGGAVSFTAMGASLSVLTAEAGASGAAAEEDNGAAEEDGPSVDDQVSDQLSFGGDRQRAADVGDAEQQDATTDEIENGGDGRSASTSEGGVSIAAAVGVNVQTAKVSAGVPNGVVISAAGALSILTASNTDGEITADGSAVGGEGTTPAQVGIGVAVAVNKVSASNEARLGVANHTVGGLNIEAGKRDIALWVEDSTSTATRTDSYLASATSGAGASNVGIAGSLALNLIDTASVALVAPGAGLTVTGGGAVSLSADNRADIVAKALPVEGAGASGDSVGVGVSAAINIVANRSRAELGNNVALAGAGGLSLSANGVFTVETQAEAGSAGGVSITPALALSLINNATSARIGSGSVLSVAGNVSVSAIQQSKVTTTASAAAAGANVAIGAALALALVNDEVIATTARSITTTSGGTVSFIAMGASLSELSATASAMGAAAEEDNGAAEEDGPSVDEQVSDQLSFGGDRQRSADVGDGEQQDATTEELANEDGRSASTSEGGVSIAAAVGVNVQTAKVSAGVPDSFVINAAGALSILTASNTDGKITADGSAVGTEGVPPSQVGIGVAVAVNKVSSSNEARLGLANHTVGGLSIEAGKRDIALWVEDSTSTATRTDSYLASATSGAGASSVGIAGSLALNLIDTESAALVAPGAGLTVTGAGTVSLTADNRSDVVAKALPVEGAGASGDDVGVGVSAAINIVANRSRAELGNNVALTGAGGLTLSANGAYSVETQAEAGSAGGVAITPALALSLVNNATSARIGSGSLLTLTGNVGVSASQTSAVTTTASAKAAGGSVAIGASLALALVDDQVLATTDRSLTATGSVSFVAAGSSTGTLSAIAGAEGAKGEDENGDDGPTVDDSVTDQLSFGSNRQGSANVGSSDQRSSTSNEVNNEEGRSAQSEEGKVSVAAAVAVNVTKSSVVAAVPNGVSINAGGRLTVSSAGTVSGAITADGSAANSQVGIGVAVAVNAIEKTNSATLGAGTHWGNGVTVSAVQYGNPADPDVDAFEAKASSGAGGSSVGIAGALALNLIKSNTTAEISGGATVNARSGTSSILADSRVTATASALPGENGGASGDDVGIGASVALNLITTNTSASLLNGATFNAGTGLAVGANSTLSTTTQAAAGASGGVAIDAVVALALLDQRTTALVGTGNGLSMGSGAITISATSGGEHLAEADGNTKAGNVGVGAAAAVVLGAGQQDGALKNTSVTSASLMRNVTAGSLSVTAESDRRYVAEATATAGGGKSDSEDSDKPPPAPATSTSTLETTKDSQQGTEGGGKVQVAAAVGVAGAQDVVTATIGAVTVNTGGAVSVDATNAINMVAFGSGAALDSNSQVGVGVGVGLAIINNTTTASIANGSTIGSSATPAGNVSVTATTSENADENRIMARAIAGASSSKVSVAGAIAVAISTSSATASIGDNVTIVGGDVAVRVDNTSKLTAKAMAGTYTSGSAGIGASVAVVVSEHKLTAAIGAGTTISARDLSVEAINQKVDIPPALASFDFSKFDRENLDDLTGILTEDALLGSSNYYAEAIGGSGGGDVAVQGSFAVMVFSDEVTASIGRSLTTPGNTAATTINATGDVTLDARNDFVAKALSGGVAIGRNVGVGISSSVIVSSGATVALLAGNASVASSVRFSATAGASQDIQVIGAGAGISTGSVGVAGVATVITSKNRTEALLGAGARVNTAGNATLRATNDFSTFSLAVGAGVGSSVGVGGAASVVVVDNITRAALGNGTNATNGVHVNAGGVFAIAALSSVEGLTVTAAGGAAGTAGIGAGAAVYVLGATTEARVGNFARIGHTTAPSALTIVAEDDTSLDTVAGALGGGGTAGAGAAAAVGSVGNTITADIGSSALVTATDVGIRAHSGLIAQTLAVGAGVGGKAGLAGAVSVYTVKNATTARIGASAGVSATNNVAVLADDLVDIGFFTGSLAGSGFASIGASASVAVVSSTTLATIAANANVTALGQGPSAVTYVTGYNPALSAFTNTDPDANLFTAPEIDTEDGQYQIAGGPDNEITTALEARRQGLRLLALDRSVTPTTATARGVIVNASGETAVRSLAVGGAFSGGASVSISANVPVITTSVTASIGNGAQINTGAGTAHAGQSVIVAAASDIYRIGIAGSVAGGTVGVGGGVEAAIVSPTTRALIGSNANVAARNDVAVSSRARQDFVGAAAAGGVGAAAAIAGGASVFSLNSETEARIGSGTTVVADSNVAVVAEDVTRSSTLAGSVAVGFGGVGIGGSIGLNLITKRTTASIDSGAIVTARGNGSAMTVHSGTNFTGTQSARGVLVYANSNESIFTLGIAGAGGLYAGVAGSVSVHLLDIATNAAIGQNARINTNNNNAGANTTPGQGQDVMVIARNSSSIAAIDGAVALSGGAGIAGAVDIGILRNTTSASIGNGAEVNATGRVSVLGLQNVDVDSIVVSAAGGIVGIAAGVSVYSIGDGITLEGEDNEETRDNVADTGEYVQSQLDDGTIGGLFDGVGGDNPDEYDLLVKSISAEAEQARNALDVENALSALNDPALEIPPGTSASVGTATIRAGGAVSVLSRDTIGTSTIAGAVAGGLVGIGAGVAVVTVDTTNTAQAVGATITGNSVQVDANSVHAMQAHSLAGGFALAVAAQASVGVLTDNSRTRAFISGGSVNTGIAGSGAVAVRAEAQRTGNVTTGGASIAGAAALGISWSAVNIGGSVNAYMSGVSVGTALDRVGSVSVEALSRNTATTDTIAVSGGIGAALLGSVADARAATSVSAAIDATSIYAQGAVALTAQSGGRARAEARGLAIAGGLAAGGSIASALVAEQVDAFIRQGSVIDAGSMAFAARVAPNLSGGPAVYASAFGSSGALVGATATDARARNLSSANALAQASTLRTTGQILLEAASTTSQHANASGYAFGVVALGSNTALATSNTTTQARMLNMTPGSTAVMAGSVRILANGVDTNAATATAGSGGVIAGSAAKASTGSTSTTLAVAEGSTPFTISAIGLVEIAATHTDNFSGSVDSIQASLAGKSGANLEHLVNATLNARLGNGMVVRAADFKIAAHNIVRNFFIGGPSFSLLTGARPNWNSDNADWNVNSGSGGLIDVPAGGSAVLVTQNTNATIGNNADVRLTPAVGALSTLSLSAYNESIVQQKVNLDSGGAIAVAHSEVTIHVTANATADVGSNSRLVVDRGDIDIAAWGNSELVGRAAATTYGLAGAPTGVAHAYYTATNTTRIREGALIEASSGTMPIDGSLPTSGTVSISAGAGLAGVASRLYFRTTVDLFNKTAIPIPIPPDAHSGVNINANLIIADSQNPTTQTDPPTPLKGIFAAGDITLNAVRGNPTISAVGIGKDIYREALAKLASAISNAFGGGDVTFDYHGGTTSDVGRGTATINGLVLAGIQRHQLLTLRYTTAACDFANLACLAAPIDGEIGYSVSDPEAMGTTILDRLAELELLVNEYDQDPIARGAYQSEISFLQNKLVALGLGSFVNGQFVSEDYVKPSAVVVNSWMNAERGRITLATEQMIVVAGEIVPVETGAEIVTAIYTGNEEGNLGIRPNANHVTSTIRPIIANTLGDLNSALNTLNNELAALLTILNNATGSAVAPAQTNYNNKLAERDAMQTRRNAMQDNLNKFDTDAATIAGLLNAGDGTNGHIQTVTNLTNANIGHQTAIDNAILAIAGFQRDLETARLAGNTGAEATAIAGINTQKGIIENRLTQIADNNTAIENRYAQAQTNASTIQSQVSTLRSWASGLADISQPNIATINGLTANTNALQTRAESVGAVRDEFQTIRTETNTRIADLGLNAYQALLLELTDNVAAYHAMLSDTAATPMSRSITVDDAVVRLANVSVFADVLTGTGSLQAPGDAKIQIINETAHTLKLGNLLIPTYDAANVRFNGVLVHDADDIAALNATGAGPVGLRIVDQLSSSRSQVIIESNYNPDSFATSGMPGIAPDIVLLSNRKILNPTGSVEITSAAGNIYIQGEIDAGSLTITAKNGDFISSYVNGFDHKGGDPGSFINPNDPTEAGRGIIVNGAISIAARYLNINSTIQSGVANWTLDLGNNPLLSTTNPAAIGLNPTEIANRITNYENEIIVNGASTTLAVISMGNGIFLNMGPRGLTLDEAPGLRTAINAYLNDTSANRSPVYNVMIGGVLQPINIRDFISGGISGRLEFQMSTLQAYMGTSGSTPADFYTVVTGTDIGPNGVGRIGATYDAANNQYVVDGTRVNGGFIQLYGQILNTAHVGGGQPAGRLNVLDGFGTINITNSSNIPVVLQTLHTGEDNTGTGRGVQGRIEITDVTGVNMSNPTNPIVSIRRTVYTRDYDPTAGGNGVVQSRTQVGTLNAQGEFVATGWVNAQGQVITTNIDNPGAVSWQDRTATYNPTAGVRYVWTTGERFRQINTFEIRGARIFNAPSLTISANLRNVDIGSPSITSRGRLADGTYLSTNSTNTTTQDAYRTANGVYFTGNPSYTSNLDPSILNNPYITSDYSYVTLSELAKTGEKSNCVWWTLCIGWNYTYFYRLTQEYTTITTHSLKADNPIGINFIGSNSGGITVNSNTDVIIAGNVTGIGGTVAITAGTSNGSSIKSVGPGAVVTGRDIVLNAGGSIGGLNHSGFPTITGEPALGVMLRGGALDAHARNGNVSIETRGNLVVGTIRAHGAVAAQNGKGNVNLVALGSIQGRNQSSLIEAPRVRLTAGGSIGSVADNSQLRVHTGFSQEGRIFGDPALDTPDFQINPDPLQGLTAHAGGDIGIRSTSGWTATVDGVTIGNVDGTMLIDQVIAGGNVRLVSSGHILDNHPIETIDSRTYDELLGYWNSLGLVGGTAENMAKQAAAILAYENAKTNEFGPEYHQYWEIRRLQADNGASYDPDFTFSAAHDPDVLEGLTQRFRTEVLTAALAEDVTLSLEEVNAAVALRIAAFEAEQTDLYHSLHAAVGGLTESYGYTASAEEIAMLTRGAEWTERELAFSLSPGALKTITATNPVIKAPNVSGGTVTLQAQTGIGETIGGHTSNPGVVIRGDIHPRDMSIAQRVALAAAERSDLQLRMVGVLVLPDDATPEQQAAYNAAIALGVGTGTTIRLGLDYDDMTAIERAALDAAALGLLPSASTEIVILSRRPLNFDARTEINVDVVAAPNGTTPDRGTAYLASRSNALLGAISVQGETRIKVIGNIANTGSKLIQTGNLVLEAAQGGIGVVTPLALSLRPGAALTARGQAGVNVAFTGDGLIDTVYSPQNVTLSATGALLNANKDDLINILGAQVVLNAATAIGTADRALNVGNNLGGGITASAAGLIHLFGPAQHLFVIKSATSANGSIILEAALEGIIDGPVTAPGSVSLLSAGRFVVSSAGWVRSTMDRIDVRAGAFKMINGAILQADIGLVRIETEGDALVTGVVTGASDDGTTAAVTILAGGRVFAGTDPDRAYDISAAATGASVSILAGLGIGDRTMANAAWQDGPLDVPGSANAITEAPNPLRILTSAMDLEALAGGIHAHALATAVTVTARAGDGDIVLTAAGTFHSPLLESPKGNVEVEAEGDITLLSVLAGTDPEATKGAIDILSRTGAINVTAATSGGTQRYEAENDITFTSLITTGLPDDIGDVHLTSNSGAIIGGNILANGSAHLFGNGVTFGSIQAGVAARITSTQAVTGTLLEAFDGGVFVDAEDDVDLETILAGIGPDAEEGTLEILSRSGAITVETATSGGTQRFEAEKDITFATLTTTGLPDDIGDVHLTSHGGAILGGSILANGSAHIFGNGVTFDAIQAGIAARITSTQAVTGTLLEAFDGGVFVDAEDDVDLETILAGIGPDAEEGTLEILSRSGAITVETATSGGTQRFEAEKDITFATLTTTGLPDDIGDVHLTSHGGAILGGSILANGSAHIFGNGVTFDAIQAGIAARITSTQAVTGTLLEAFDGGVFVDAEDDVDLETILAGIGPDAEEGTLEILSRSGAITVETATSGGTQRFEAEKDITFTTLTTTGLPADIGDVHLTSHGGAIRGGDIFANGSTYIFGNGVYFGTIDSKVDSRITSTGDIIGAAQIAGNAIVNSAGSTGGPGSIIIDLMRARTVSLNATGSIILPNLEVAEEAALGANDIDANITHVPPGPDPLRLTITGPNGSVGQFARVNVDAPAGLVFPQLRFYESEVSTTARFVSIVSAFVPGSLWLQTPLQTLLFENRVPTPQQGNNVQMYEPSFAFMLELRNFRTITDAFVVHYDVTAQVTNLLNGLPYHGASLVRDSIRAMYHGPRAEDGFYLLFGTQEGGDPEFEQEEEDGTLVIIDGITYPIVKAGTGPAVQLSQLN